MCDWFCYRQSKERESLQKRQQLEMEEFLHTKGYNIPASPLITTATGNLSTAPMLSPLNMSNIPNPPPLPASLMSIPVTDNFPMFSMAHRRPHTSKGSTGSFNEELYKYVEDLAARHQASSLYAGNMTPATRSDTASRTSETACTETVDHRSSSPRMSYTTVDSGQSSEDPPSDAHHAGQSPAAALMQEGMIPNAQILVPNHQMYNLHYPGSSISSFVSMSSPYSGTQFVEAGLLPMTNSYTPVVPVSTVTQTGTTTHSISSTSSSKTQYWVWLRSDGHRIIYIALQVFHTSKSSSS